MKDDILAIMFGLLLTALASFAREISISIGKDSVAHHKESMFSMGFLNTLAGTIFIVLVAILIPRDFFIEGFPGGFVFDPASIPTLTVRILLDIILVHIVLVAIVQTDRSTFGFLRIITLPLLLFVDLFLGYALSGGQILGIILIVISLIAIFWTKGIHRKGSGLIIISSIISVATVSLYKYNITNFNSVEAEQVIVKIVLLIYLFIMARFIAKENPFLCFKQRKLLAHSVASGVSSIFMAFAYLLAPASIITTGKRSFGLLFATLSGNIYFHECGIWRKVLALIAIIIGIGLLAGLIG